MEIFLLAFLTWLVIWDCKLWKKLKHYKREKPYICAITPGSGFYYYIKRHVRTRKRHRRRQN